MKSRSTTRLIPLVALMVGASVWAPLAAASSENSGHGKGLERHEKGDEGHGKKARITWLEVQGGSDNQCPQGTPLDTALRETPLQTPLQTPFQTPLGETPLRAAAVMGMLPLTETPLRTSPQTPLHTSLQTPLQTPLKTPLAKPFGDTKGLKKLVIQGNHGDRVTMLITFRIDRAISNASFSISPGKLTGRSHGDGDDDDDDLRHGKGHGPKNVVAALTTSLKRADGVCVGLNGRSSLAAGDYTAVLAVALGNAKKDEQHGTLKLREGKRTISEPLQLEIEILN